MYHVHFNIGSNLGDREANIKRAVASLRLLASISSSVRISDPMVSSPWGFISDNDFINVGVSLDTDISPDALLAATQRIQQSISTASHRDSTGTYIDRLIDIDIIAICKVEAQGLELLHISTERLTLPHPRAMQRDFVIVPMRQIDLPLYELLRAVQ